MPWITSLAVQFSLLMTLDQPRMDYWTEAIVFELVPY